jgi:integrase
MPIYATLENIKRRPLTLPIRCPGVAPNDLRIGVMMLQKKSLTDRGLKALRPAEKGKRYVVWDSVVPSFGVRVTDKADKNGYAASVSFIVMRRCDGKLLRRTIGDYPRISLDKARDKARDAIEDLLKGVDPKVREAEERVAREQKKRDNFELVAEAFIKRHVATLRQSREVEALVRNRLISRWGTRAVTSITKTDVIALLDDIVEDGSMYAAHKALATCSKLFNWTIARDSYGLQVSPCDRIRAADVIGRKVHRQRILNDDEIRVFWKACGILGTFGPLFRMLLLTGQRRDEVGEMSWSEVDLAKKIWTIPPVRMKTDAAHVVPLSDEAVKILEAIPRYASGARKGDFVFTTTAGERPVSGYSKLKIRLDQLMLKRLKEAAAERGEDADTVKLEPWRLHDLRRTARTHFSAIPAPDMVRELAISHTRPGLHKVYDQWAYLDEKRALFEAWAKRLMGIVAPPEEGNVIKLKETWA